MFVWPRPVLNPRPSNQTSPTQGSDEVHLETVVMSCVEPSLNRPVAVNCSIAPRPIVGDAGVTVMLWTVALDTVNVLVAGTRFPNEAVMVTDPLARPYATPDQLMVASS